MISTFKVVRTAVSQVGVKKALKGGDEFWNAAKPTQVDAVGLKKSKPQGYIRWDDDFVMKLNELSRRANSLFSFRFSI